MTPTTARSRPWPSPGRGVRTLLPLLIVVAMAGCGRAGTTPVAVTPAATAPALPALATPPPATPSPQEPQFSDIVWTYAWSDQPGETPVAVAEFQTDSPVIIALSRARALPMGAQVDAAWTYNNTTLEAFSTGMVNNSASSDIWLAFRLERDPDQLWPAGTYQVALSLNGVEVISGATQVIESP